MKAKRRRKTKAVKEWPIERLPVATLMPADYNPRSITPEALDGLEASVTTFGMVEPIVYNRRTGRVVGGHQRLKVLQRRGVAETDVVVVDLPEEKERALNVVLNNPAIAGTFTPDVEELLEEADRITEGVLDGLRLDELVADLQEGLAKEAKAAAPAKGGQKRGKLPPGTLPKRPVTKKGTLWRLGRHRLLCGDCTDADQVARVLGRAGPAPLLVTDPPYCSGSFQEAGKSAGTWGTIASDTLSTRGYVSLMERMLAASNPQAGYVFTDWRMWVTLFDLVERKGLPVRNMIVWDKGTPALGSLWRNQHELVLFASRGGVRRRKGPPSVGNVIQAKRTGNKLHYTEKPVELIRALVSNDGNSDRKACPVFDPFCGSGPILAACEELGRSARTMEVEPGFCDVAVRRWEKMTGDTAQLENR